MAGAAHPEAKVGGAGFSDGAWNERALERETGGLSRERALGVLAGGCDSPVRSGWSVGGPMFVQSRANGAYAYDEAGRRYIDYIMAYGPLLFGHTHPALTTGLDEIAAGGFVWG